ncbi:hypothetical protein SAMN04488003_10366 [Loktanella fryxellensis]|uniref:Glycosyl transferase family 2 n=1 Tax=Loktanella fryxellensis TaxID=245187 RepID=A0A1H8A8K8_9RHOB|nr:hypothetical protein [Loktanella fryxellensis]SEM67030.1 hypothetical protein SAMN04488003_10366 [Loktanella fryxellensis]
MIHTSLNAFLTQGRDVLSKGPIALILMEDAVEVDSTLRHHIDAGFRVVVAVGAAQIAVDHALEEHIIRVHHDMLSPDALTTVVNGVIDAAPGQWIFYGYNTEYLFYPFCETRTVGEMLAFSTEERRDSLLTYVVDLYAGDLSAHPTAVSRPDAHLDRSGYYALARKDRDGEFCERQLDFFGGLRWRFEEHVPAPRRRIDRVSLFRARPGLRLTASHTFNDPEYNTYACPWHNSLTAALCSFRTAKALRRNAGSAPHIHSFRWHNSEPFRWESRQLLDLGLMEPGQWF